MASLLAWARDFTSPCLPFCSSEHCHQSRFRIELERFTYIPLGETEVHDSAALRGETRGFLQGAAHRAGGDGQVAVVAGVEVSIDSKEHWCTRTSNRRLSRQQSF